MAQLGTLTVDAAGRVDVSDGTDAICRALGIDKTSVAALRILPDELWVDIWLGREGLDGPKYADADGRAATATLRYRVRT